MLTGLGLLDARFINRSGMNVLIRGAAAGVEQKFYPRRIRSPSAYYSLPVRICFWPRRLYFTYSNTGWRHCRSFRCVTPSARLLKGRLNDCRRITKPSGPLQYRVAEVRFIMVGALGHSLD